MARPMRVEFSGGLFHVTSRGNAQGDIFLSDVDRACFLGVLADVVKIHNWIVHAYCLMDNHYHLLIETPDAADAGGQVLDIEFRMTRPKRRGSGLEL